MSKYIDITGQIFGRLTVIKRVENNKHNQVQYLCLCKCGNKKIITKNGLINGNYKSCGCLKKEQDKINLKSPTHNMSNTRLYNIWRGMKWRCTSKKNKRRKFYLDKNINVCDEWKNNFMSFYKWAIDNGYNDNLTIDRINNNGDYEPDNCRWATYTEQNNNQSTSKKYIYKNKTYTLKELSGMTGIKLPTLYQRLEQSKWEINKAINTPVKTKNIQEE